MLLLSLMTTPDEEASKRLRVKKSRNGKGIFTRVSLSQDEIIFTVVGKKITFERLEKTGGKLLDNAFRYSKRFYLCPTGTGDFLNHSCGPNARVVKHRGELSIIAIKEINKNEEITIDYSTILAKDDPWRMDCNCGSENCRTHVRAFHTIPRSLQRRYVTHRIVPSYILDLNV